MITALVAPGSKERARPCRSRRGRLAKRPNFGFQKRQKEIERKKKQDEKAARKKMKKEAAAGGEADGITEAVDERSGSADAAVTGTEHEGTRAG